MEKDDLIKRWHTPEGVIRQSRLLEVLTQPINWGKILEGFPGTDEIRDAVDLRGMVVRNKDLRGAELTYSALNFAVFDECCLSGVNLFGSCLDSASFRRADISNAILSQISAQYAIFDETDLRKSFLDASILCSASFVFSKLEKSCCAYSDFSNAVFRQADLSSADFFMCNLKEADFTDAVTDGANFRETKS